MLTRHRHDLATQQLSGSQRHTLAFLVRHWLLSVVISLVVAGAFTWVYGLAQSELPPEPGEFSAPQVEPAPLPTPPESTPEPVTQQEPEEEPDRPVLASGDEITISLEDLRESEFIPKDARPVRILGIGSFVLVISSGNTVQVDEDDLVPLPPTIERYDVDPRSNILALTFDDGPHPIYTPMVLDVLKEHKARATFFVVGELAEKYPDVVNRILEEGHEIANHGYTHRVDHSTTYPDLVIDTLKTRDIIKQICGHTTKWYRPNNMLITPVLLHAMEMSGHTMVLWTIDTKDWAAESAEEIVENAFRPGIQPGHVMLFHDGGGNRQRTAEALGPILTRLASMGYKSVTLSELVDDAQNRMPGESYR